LERETGVEPATLSLGIGSLLNIDGELRGSDDLNEVESS
jgi:hypothetical protein